MLYNISNFHKKITKTINQIQRNFIWGSTAKKKKVYLLSWEKITMTKDKGGLGLQKSELGTKLQMLAYHGECSITLKLFGKEFSITNTAHSTTLSPRKGFAPEPGNTLKKGNTCLKNHIWIVYKGNRVKFFEDNWIPNHKSIRNSIEVPLNKREDNLTLENMYN